MLCCHCKLLRYRIRYYYHVFCQLYDHIPELLRPCICIYWYWYPLRKYHDRQLLEESAEQIRVSTPSEVSLHSSPTSFCPISLEGSTPWPMEILYSCKSYMLFVGCADSQYRCHHFRQFQIIPYAPRRPMVDRFRLLYRCSLRQNLLG